MYQRFADALNQYEIASSIYHRADQERSSLTLHETSAKSIVGEATRNSEKRLWLLRKLRRQ
jgi:serine/threonine-protein kinase SMG1